MKTITRKYKTYQFNELSDESKEKALNDNRCFNVDYDWWDANYEGFREDLAEHGISCKTFFFDLDRGSYIAMDKPSIDDEKKYLKRIGIDLRTKLAREIIEDGIPIETQYYGGGTSRNYINDFGTVDLDTPLQDLLNDFLSRLQQDYEYLISDESIIESLKANEYTFLEDGSIFF